MAGQGARRMGGGSSRHGRALVWLVVAWWLWAPVASAQDVATSLEELAYSGKLEPGGTVYVTDRLGERVRATVHDLSSSWLEIDVNGGTVILGEVEIAEIARPDPVSNGVWRGMGVAAGFVAAVCVNEAISRRASNCIEFVFRGGLQWVGVGTLIGWGIDYVVRETVYRKPGSASLKVSPVFSTEGAGAGVTLSW